MLTDHLLSNILKASEKNAKVVFLGDPNQLLPIGTGNAFDRMTKNDNEQFLCSNERNQSTRGRF